VVGIVSAKYSSYANAAVEGLGFAIPINDVSAMIEDIMTNGFVTNKPYLGINGGSMTEQMAAQYRYNITKGVFVYSVEEGFAAAEAGLKLGDVITMIDDHEITSLEDLTSVKKYYSAGDTATFTIYRDGASTTADVTWSAVPQEDQTNLTPEQPAQNPQYGQCGQNPYYYYSNPFDMFDYFFGNGFW
jgi:serine protease Do